MSRGTRRGGTAIWNNVPVLREEEGEGENSWPNPSRPKFFPEQFLGIEAAQSNCPPDKTSAVFMLVLGT